MNANSSLIWKVVYGVAIALLLYPLFQIGRPATSGEQGDNGGVLAQLRREYNLSQANLGEIDPASESMKLATLGMRGVAANILWHKSINYKKTEDWDNLSATLNQITKLQPNFISVWESQAHNLSYNVSVEFDNYEHRYHWVKKGIDFLMKGTEYNRDEPRLLHEVGWYVGQKIGRSDEHEQFRRLFRTDLDFHRSMEPHVRRITGSEVLGPERLYPDNWLVSYLWYDAAEEVIDQKGVPLKGKSPLVFHADKPMAKINYALAIEEEGVFGEAAQKAWRRGEEEYVKYGDRQIPSSWGVTIRLNDQEEEWSEARRLERELDELAQSRDRLREERLAGLSDRERELVDTPLEDRGAWGPGQWDILFKAENKMTITHLDVAEAAPSDVRETALRLARKLGEVELHADRIRRYRDTVNFNYWRTRCEVEQKPIATDARQALHDANQLLEQGRVEQSRQKFEEAWDKWAAILEEYPSLSDNITADELNDQIKRYRYCMEQLGEEFPPEDFKLQWVIDRFTYDQAIVAEDGDELLNNPNPAGSPELP